MTRRGPPRVRDRPALLKAEDVGNDRSRTTFTYR